MSEIESATLGTTLYLELRDQKGLLLLPSFSLVFLCVPEPLRQLDSRLGPKQQEDLAAIQPVVPKRKGILVGYIYTV